MSQTVKRKQLGNLKPEQIVSVTGESVSEMSVPLPDQSLQGRRLAVVVMSDYPNDPRPRRAAEAMAEQGMRVEVICSKRHQDDPAHQTLNGVDIYRLPIKHQRGGKLGYAFQYFGFLTASFALLTIRSCKGRYSLVHVHNMPDFLVFSALVPKLLGSKVILDMHDPMPELMRTIYGIAEQSRAVRLLKIFEKISLGFADAVITVNQTCKKMFAARSCHLDKIHVIMNSPDEVMFPLVPPSPPVKETEATGYSPRGNRVRSPRRSSTINDQPSTICDHVSRIIGGTKRTRPCN